MLSLVNYLYFSMTVYFDLIPHSVLQEDFLKNPPNDLYIWFVLSLFQKHIFHSIFMFLSCVHTNKSFLLTFVDMT